MNQFAKPWVRTHLSKLQKGQITFKDQHGHCSFGKEDDLKSLVVINNAAFYTKMMLQGSLGPAISYIDGDWDTDNLTDLIRIIIRNQEATGRLDRFFSKIPQLLYDQVAKFKKNTLKGSMVNIHAHYDLGNTFFQTFLDETLLYSCAHFDSDKNTLREAQSNKMRKVTEMLQAQPNDHILEIGAGWGSLAIHLAQKVGCHVTTTTTSTRQYEYVKRRIQKLALEDKITLLRQDYRTLEGRYSKIVSIEMIEALGHQYFDLFFSQCNRLLKEGGLLMIQAITMNEQSYEKAKDHVDYIKKYIFPHSCLPSIQRIAQSVASQTQLQWVTMNDIGKHYVTTLLYWRKRFLENAHLVRQLGFSEEFVRHWEYYLCYCEAGFQEGYMNGVQFVLKKL